MTKSPTLDGKKRNVMPDESVDVAPDLFEVHKALLADGWELWKNHRDAVTTPGLNHKADPIRYSRISIVSFSQIAAVTAVDVGLTEEQFLATCKANYQGAVKRAPRFG
jgi:hypothetical protein